MGFLFVLLDIRKNIAKKYDEVESKTRSLNGLHLKTIAIIAFCWSLFALYASPFFYGWFWVFIDVPARAIHLSFALIAFLSYPLLKR